MYKFGTGLLAPLMLRILLLVCRAPIHVTVWANFLMFVLLNASDMSLAIGYETRNTCCSYLLDQVFAGVDFRESDEAGVNHGKVLAQLL